MLDKDGEPIAVLLDLALIDEIGELVSELEETLRQEGGWGTMGWNPNEFSKNSCFYNTHLLVQ